MKEWNQISIIQLKNWGYRNMKFRVVQEADYVIGHLRYGHREGIVEADSKEEALELLKGNEDDYLDLVVDDYEIEDADFGDNPFEIEEVDD